MPSSVARTQTTHVGNCWKFTGNMQREKRRAMATSGSPVAEDWRSQYGICSTARKAGKSSGKKGATVGSNTACYWCGIIILTNARCPWGALHNSSVRDTTKRCNPAGCWCTKRVRLVCCFVCPCMLQSGPGERSEGGQAFCGDFAKILGSHASRAGTQIARGSLEWEGVDVLTFCMSSPVDRRSDVPRGVEPCLDKCDCR